MTLIVTKNKINAPDSGNDNHFPIILLSGCIGFNLYFLFKADFFLDDYFDSDPTEGFLFIFSWTLAAICILWIIFNLIRTLIFHK